MEPTKQELEDRIAVVEAELKALKLHPLALPLPRQKAFKATWIAEHKRDEFPQGSPEWQLWDDCLKRIHQENAELEQELIARTFAADAHFLKIQQKEQELRELTDLLLSLG